MRATSTLFALLIGLVFVSLTAPTALADAPLGAEAAKPLAVGDHAPAFSVEFADGKPYRFDPKVLSGPQIVIFYRGGWCPYCNMQLSDMRLVEPKLRASGFDIVFLSTDRPQLLYTSPKEKNLNYTLLSDSQLQAAEAFHVAYKLDDTTYTRQLKYGVDLEKTTGNGKHELPVPSVFIIDKSGMIRYVYSNPDYTVRLGADDLWKAAQPYATAGKAP